MQRRPPSRPDLKQPSRRAVLAAGGALVLTAGRALAHRSPEPKMPPSPLQAALRAFGGPVCLAAATAIDGATRRGQPLGLNLRGADLTPAQGQAVAAGVRALGVDGGPRLVSVSLSYSRRMGDDAAVDLLDALPTTMESLGLVGCGLSDATGMALLRWAARCPRLSMVCVEDNRFSAPMRRRIASLADDRPGLLIVV